MGSQVEGGRTEAHLDSTIQCQPPKSEFRRPNPEGRPNTESQRHASAFRTSGFDLLSALGFRASGLVPYAQGLVVPSRYARRTEMALFPLALLGVERYCWSSDCSGVSGRRTLGSRRLGQAPPTPGTPDSGAGPRCRDGVHAQISQSGVDKPAVEIAIQSIL
jgi:hypothetical protein